MNPDRRYRIRALNDALRQKHEGGRVALTAAVAALPAGAVTEIIAAVRAFDRSATDNDPYREHDFRSLSVGDERVMWKIACYDHSLRAHSPDAADPSVTTRVLTIMLASDY